MKTSGFTLIEMLIAITVLAILLAIAVPNFQGFIVRNRISTQASDMIADLALARSEAIKRGTRVGICTSSDGASCTVSAWNAGRMIFTDADADGVLDATETILRVSQPAAGGNTLAADADIANYVAYLPIGTVAATGNLTLCRTGYKGRVIAIGTTGRVSSTETPANCS